MRFIKLSSLICVVFITLLSLEAPNDDKGSNKGEIIHHLVFSKSLQEQREISVYLPPNYDSNTNYPIVYILDDFCDNVARRIEPLIVSKVIEPIIIVSPGDKPKKSYDSISIAYHLDYRQLEYLGGAPIRRYGEPEIPDDMYPSQALNRHKRYIEFTEYVLDTFISEKYKFDTNLNNTIGGFSNGADFSLIYYYQHPNQFNNVIPLSAGRCPRPNEEEIKKVSANFYIASGEYEESFNKRSLEFAAYLRQNHFQCTDTTMKYGHDERMWLIAFEKFIKEIYQVE